MRALKKKMAEFGHRNRVEKGSYDENYFVRTISGPPVSVHYLWCLLPTIFKNAEFMLDAGCGKGECVSILNDCGKNAVGIDLSSFAARTSKQICGDISNMPFKDGVFDGLIAFEVIEHLTYSEVVRFLTECRRVLKDDGVLALSTPNWLPRIMLWLRGISDFTHRAYFNPISIRKTLRSCGFDKVRVTCSFELKHRTMISLRGVSLLALLGFGIVAVSGKPL